MNWTGTVATAPSMVHTYVGGADMAHGTCSVDGCDVRWWARGLCPTHYSRLRQGAALDAPVKHTRRLSNDFWSHVDQSSPDGCWEWQGTRETTGYGRWPKGGVQRRSHRLAYELVYGPIPKGMWVLHHCDNPPCVKVTGDPEWDHLYLGTPRRNTLDREERRPQRNRNEKGQYA